MRTFETRTILESTLITFLEKKLYQLKIWLNIFCQWKNFNLNKIIPYLSIHSVHFIFISSQTRSLRERNNKNILIIKKKNHITIHAHLTPSDIKSFMYFIALQSLVSIIATITPWNIYRYKFNKWTQHKQTT